MVPPEPRPSGPVEIVVRIKRRVCGLWAAEAKAHDMEAKHPGMDTPEQAARVVVDELWKTAVALGREEWFW